MSHRKAVTEQNTVAFGSNLEYGLEEAVVPIQEFIDALMEAQDDGAEYVTLLSGNYRGGQFLKPSTRVNFLDNE